MELEELVEKFRMKDAKAFEKLYSMYADNICGVIYNIVKNTDIAQEICQDVFGSSRLVPKWHRNHVNYVTNWSKLANVHLELAGSYQMDMVILMNSVKFGQDAFGSSRH